MRCAESSRGLRMIGLWSGAEIIGPRHAFVRFTFSPPTLPQRRGKDGAPGIMCALELRLEWVGHRRIVTSVCTH
jgi:hypothetical protein